MNQISLSAFTDFNSAVPWGLWVNLYVWFMGISACSFMLLCWWNLKNNADLKHLTRMGIIVSIATFLAGLLSIQIDLGHIERFYKLFTSPNPTSPMSLMTIMYGIYFIILAISLLRLKNGLSRGFLKFSFIFAFFVIMVECLLFAKPPGRHWHSIIFIIHFFTSAFAASSAALLLITNITWTKNRKDEILSVLAKVALRAIIINLAVEILEQFVSSGARSSLNWIAIAGHITAVIFLSANGAKTTIYAGIIELGSVFLSKYATLISAQVVEPYRDFSKAYIEPRLQFSYFPTFFEMLVAAVLITVSFGLFYFIYKVFPLTREE